MLGENTSVVWVCFACCALTICAAMAQHKEVGVYSKVFVSLVVVSAFFLAGHLIADRNRETELTKNEGVLVPASDPIAANTCEFLNPGEFYIHMGGVVFHSPHKKITLLVLDGINYFTISLKNGRLFIDSLKIFDDRYDLIAGIHPDQVFWISPGSRRDRPDESTLIVYDHTDTQVLSMRYNNKDRLSLKGIFHTKKGVALIASDEGVTYNKFVLSGDGCIDVADDEIGVLPRLFGVPN